LTFNRDAEIFDVLFGHENFMAVARAVGEHPGVGQKSIDREFFTRLQLRSASVRLTNVTVTGLFEFLDLILPNKSQLSAAAGVTTATSTKMETREWRSAKVMSWFPTNFDPRRR
jgi:hypothetical protein